jgi:hypothetical protein
MNNVSRPALTLCAFSPAPCNPLPPPPPGPRSLGSSASTRPELVMLTSPVCPRLAGRRSGPSVSPTRLATTCRRWRLHPTRTCPAAPASAPQCWSLPQRSTAPSTSGAAHRGVLLPALCCCRCGPVPCSRAAQRVTHAAAPLLSIRAATARSASSSALPFPTPVRTWRLSFRRCPAWPVSHAWLQDSESRMFWDAG